MKKILVLVLFCWCSILYPQKTIYFECSKVGINEINSNAVTVKNWKSIIKLDFENQQIVILTYNGNSKNGQKITYNYFKDIRNDDNSHSYLIANYSTNESAVITLDAEKQKITLLEEKYYIFYYEKFYLEN